MGPQFAVLLGSASGFVGGSVAYSDLNTMCQAMVNANVFATPTAGGTLTIGGNAMGSYDFLILRGAQTVSSFTAASWFTATADSRSAFVIVDGNLTINSGQVFTPAVRKLFTCIYVRGTLTVNGQIAMDARGANHSATGSNITPVAIAIATGTFSAVTNPGIPATGTAGGASVVGTVSGNQGVDSTNDGKSGGGGSGGDRNGGGSGAGAAGTAFSGGPGGGGGDTLSGAAGSGVANGGSGGVGNTGASGSQGGGGGAGNPGGAGAGTTGGTGGSGTGGTLIIFCLGTYSGSGTVTAAGTVGGTYSGGSAGASGAGSGGGSVNIICTTNSGPTPTALGGLGGANTINGTVLGARGGNGTARVLTGL